MRTETLSDAAYLSRAATAFHESAHAMTALSCGAPRVKIVTIIPEVVPEGILNGYATLTPPRSDLMHLTTVLAGPITSGIILGVDGLENCFSLGDQTSADEILSKHFGKPVDRNNCDLFKTAARIAKNECKQLWPAISHLAKWLLMYEVASGELVREIFDQFQTV